MIEEGIKKNPLNPMFTERPKTPPNTGVTSMKTAPEGQTQQWKFPPLVYCKHKKTVHCHRCMKEEPCPKHGKKNCKSGCKHRLCSPCYQCKGKQKAPLNEEEALRMGVRFQKQVPLSQKEKELLKKGKLPSGRLSEHRSERSDAPEPSTQNPETQNENENEEQEQPPADSNNNNNTANPPETTTGNGGNGDLPPTHTGAGGNPDNSGHESSSSSDSSLSSDDENHHLHPIQIAQRKRRRTENFITRIVQNLRPLAQESIKKISIKAPEKFDGSWDKFRHSTTK